jgi:hypothetical protein
VTGVDAVVTHHTDGFRSGVARFNELLAARLGVPVVNLGGDSLDGPRRPLLSFKVSELPTALEPAVASLLRDGREWEAFLHDYCGLELERRIVEGAARVHCGNLEIYEAVHALNGAAHAVWTPGLLNDDRPDPEAELTVFSFGMAHKIRTDMFRRLRDLLEASSRSYAVFVSAANHETSSLRDAESVFAEMHELFPKTLYFLGNLSDVAISHQLRRSTYYAAFFPKGVRANNTSVASAMEHGAVVITNLDDYSPEQLVHGVNVLDIARIDRLPDDPSAMLSLRESAAATARAYSWEVLMTKLREQRT